MDAHVLSGPRLSHGHARSSNASKEYKSWQMMKARCENPNNISYARYGARGISVCERWSKFENFLADMGSKPNPRMSIERRENDLGYFPGNCIWATGKQQARNRRSTKLVTAFGETKSLADWAEDDRCVVTYFTLRDRIKRGDDPEAALSSPVHIPKRPWEELGMTKPTYYRRLREGDLSKPIRPYTTRGV